MSEPTQSLSSTTAPTQSQRVAQMRGIQNEALQLFAKKNADYGDAFAKYGVVGVIVRLEDKLQRCINIQRTSITMVNTESLRDTLLDLHNYSAMAIMLMDGASDDSGDVYANDHDSRDVYANDRE
jgi:hypothetical protein